MWNSKNPLLVSGGGAVLSLALCFHPGTANAFTEEFAQSVASTMVVLSPVIVPSLVVGGSAALTVEVVEQTAKGTRYLLRRASDGLEVSIESTLKVASRASISVGESVVATTVASGVVLTDGSVALAFIPNELGRALLHNERLDRSEK